jgi:hypothetical protein
MNASDRLTSDGVVPALVERFPELREAIANVDGEGLHVVFGRE